MSRRSSVIVILVWFAAFGCSTVPPQEEGGPSVVEPPVESAPMEQTPAMRAPSRSETAVAVILLDAESAIRRGRYNIAAAQLERALRIEPGNPHIWHDLARVRLNQGRYGQAANLAAKSNALARGDQQLRAANQQIIDMARRSRQ
jgi:Flp pilus assembly protein TadD